MTTKTFTAGTSTGLSYRDAGVDIDAGNALVGRIKHITRQTRRDGVLGGLGGFGALFEIPAGRFRQPVLVSATDGVGTKLKLALSLERHDTVGIDLVAMCANDLVVLGAEPLFFLDYYATGRLNVDVAVQVVEGIGRGCELAGCALVGGETAEMPGMYAPGDYDLAGFCVGVVEKDRIISGDRVRAGDALIGIASSGPHSNGYSLIRKVLEVSGADLDQPCGETDLGRALLEPTRIYVKSLLPLFADGRVHALAHITGGGLPENLPRVLPSGTAAVVDPAAWPRPEVFQWLQKSGKIGDFEMFRTFNCGIGMVLCVPEVNVAPVLAHLSRSGERAWVIGRIEDSRSEKPAVVLEGVETP